MDKQQKTALILMPIIAIVILAGGMLMSGQEEQASVEYADGVYEGEGEGFGGPIKVEVAVEDGNITSIELLEHDETPGIGDTGAEAVIADIIGSQNVEVEVSSGATFSSEGVMEAVSNALGSAGGSQAFTDGEFEGQAEGFGGPISVKVVVEGGEITSIELLEHSETEGIGDTGAEEVIANIIESQNTQVDVSSGATFSSEAVMEAVSNALSN